MIRRLITIALIVFIVLAGSFLLFPKLGSRVSQENYIASGMERCHKSEINKGNCLRELASDFLDHFTIPEILVVFAEHEREEAFFTTCHEEAHYLGREAYKRIGSLARVYAQSNETCLGGVFHGALEGYFMEKKLTLGPDNIQEIRRAVSSICKEVEVETPHAFNQCHHGLGHALMFATEDNLVDALSLCDALDQISYKENCYTGAFMQNANNAGSVDHPTAMVRDDDPLYPCPVLEEHQQSICYTYAVLERFQGDVAKGIELCGMIPVSLKENCFRTFGRNGVMHTDDVFVLEDNCRKIPEKEYQGPCLAATANSLLARYELGSPLPAEFCSILDENYKMECYVELGNFARGLVTDQAEAVAFCEKIPERIYEAACKGESL